MKARGMCILLVLTAAVSLIPNGWEAIKTTRRCWRYRQEREIGSPYNYGDPWMADLHRLLQEHIRPKDEIMMLAEPRPCTLAYGAYINTSYMLCPKRLHYFGDGFDPQKAEWLYYPYDEDDCVKSLFKTLVLTNNFQKTGKYSFQTLYRRNSSTRTP